MNSGPRRHVPVSGVKLGDHAGQRIWMGFALPSTLDFGEEERVGDPKILKFKGSLGENLLVLKLKRRGSDPTPCG